MPLVPTKLLEPTVAAPTRPHLGLLTQEFGALSTIPIHVGAVMMIIMDPNDIKRGMYPIALVKVSPKRLDFQCPCGQGNCTRRVVFHATWTGLHPRGTNEISVK